MDRQRRHHKFTNSNPQPQRDLTRAQQPLTHPHLQKTPENIANCSLPNPTNSIKQPQ
jgi:hypothetical protein